MILLGYILGVLIGICLGMMGAGGAIMTIPVLVYVFGIDTETSTTYSLFIVGITAMIGTVGYIRNNFYDFKTVVFFGLPSIVSVILTSKFLLPAIPNVVFSAGSFEITRPLLIMILFAILMILSALAMIRSSRAIQKEDYSGLKKYRYGLILLQGLLVGIITGLLGAGGGFIIVPALVILAHLPMKKAVGTSLVIITTNCVFGFLTKMSFVNLIDWNFLLIFSVFTVAGIISGIFFSKYVNGEKLKFWFACFMLIMGAFLIVQESLKMYKAGHQKNTSSYLFHQSVKTPIF